MLCPYLKCSHISTVSLYSNMQLSPETVAQVMAQLGVDVDDGVGVDYHSVLPHLAAAFSD